MPGFTNVIFSDKLSDNLASVGKLTEGGLMVMFDKDGSKIFKSDEVEIKGKPIHVERIDRLTGLYPLTLNKRVSTCNWQNTCSECVDDILWARQLFLKRRAVEKPFYASLIQLPPTIEQDMIAEPARVYIREGLSEFDRWHNKCGHVGMKYLKLLGIKSLSGKTPKVIRCESCISSKIHRMGHKNLHKTERPTYAPGDWRHTDLMGPYVRSSGGAYYAQLFKDIGSNYKWCHWMARKTGADQAVEQVLIDCKARSGKDVKIIKTDGDGVFTSKR